MKGSRLIVRLAAVVVAVVAGLVVSLALDPPYFWWLAAALAGVACVGTNVVVRVHPHIHRRNLPYTLTFWIVPALLTLGATLFLRLLSDGPWLALGLAVSGLLLGVVVLAEFRTVDLHDPYYGLARFVLNLATYLVAFALFAAVYNARVRSLQSATAVLFFGTLLALELFRESEADAGRSWLHAGLAGLVLGEATWALNWWPLSGLAGGIFLLLVFYVVTGVIQSHLAGRLTRNAAVEFGLVTATGLAFLFSSGLWLR